jgi:Protein of unknown function (DUF2490)
MRLLLVLAIALAPTLARAEGESQVWEALFLQYRPTAGGFAGWFDGQVRRGSTTIMLLRPAIGWGFGKDLTIHAGYGNIQTFVDMGDDKTEHRFWQQALYVKTLSEEVTIQGRFRVEQRFVDGDDKTGHRVRTFGYLRYGPQPTLPQLVIWDELFIQLNDTSKLQSGFNQNRAFFGLGADTKLKGLRVEGGYVNVRFGDANMNKTDHVMLVALLAVIR